MPLVKFLGSLRFAITLIVSLALILSASTIFESVYGTPFAQKNFYTAYWFDVFMGLLWINLFCAALTRFPYKKHHTGFVITHVGILTLLIGAFLSRGWGVEGQMTVFEHETKNHIVQTGFVLTASDPAGKTETFNLRSGAKRLPVPVPFSGKYSGGLSVAEILVHASVTRFLVESDGSKNPAVHLAVSSEMMGFEEKITLIGEDADNPRSFTKEAGPAKFILKKMSSGAADLPAVRLVVKRSGEEVWDKELGPVIEDGTALGKSGLRFLDFRYLPRAKIENDGVVDTAGGPFNPAVEFQVTDGANRFEYHTKFLIFPDFASLRGGKSADFFGLKVSIEAPADEVPAGPALVLYPSEQGWRYEVYSSNGLSKNGSLKLKDKIETGWRDITVTAVQMYHHASIVKKIKKTGEGGVFAVRLTRNEQQSVWLTETGPVEIRTAGVPLTLSLEPVKSPLPYELTLKDFRKKDYPGTSSPASFESDVTLYDPVKNITLEKTIRMNEPLDYAGFRIFQASYIQHPERGEASVFTIAKNPGIGLIYGGGVIILLGVILLFYLHPFFNPDIQKKIGGV